jgi:ADP-ribosyl-[dinitrogen reductase] hydrolase
MHCPVPGCWEQHPLDLAVRAVAAGSFKAKEPPEIEGSGYVVDSLEAALWAFHKSSSFREGLLLAVNLGDDADTTGAIFGQIAGAHYGFPGIPEEWRSKVANADLILQLADQLGVH